MSPLSEELASFRSLPNNLSMLLQFVDFVLVDEEIVATEQLCRWVAGDLGVVVVITAHETSAFIVFVVALHENRARIGAESRTVAAVILDAVLVGSVPVNATSVDRKDEKGVG